MFDTLTEDERNALNLKLSGWAHNLFEVGHTLARVSLAIGADENVIWDQRERYVAARSEIIDVRADLMGPDA